MTRTTHTRTDAAPQTTGLMTINLFNAATSTPSKITEAAIYRSLSPASEFLNCLIEHIHIPLSFIIIQDQRHL
jgi:hypothetical protein